MNVELSRRAHLSASSRPTALACATVIGVVAALTVVPPAHAQYGMGPGGMPAPPMGGAHNQPAKEEGPAEKAPEEPGQPSDLEPVGGYAEQSRRRSQLFELDGYFRMRTDYLYNLSLSQGYSGRQTWIDPSTGTVRAGTPPFPRPLSCPNAYQAMDVPVVSSGMTRDPSSPAAPCGDKSLAAANIRLRLEPTLNVSDRVRVLSQIDVLDNTILGSTPDSLAGLDRVYADRIPQAPIPFLYTTQDPPEIGINGYTSSIRAKRAWAEIDTEFGSLRFGRMPWHFGRGISFNNGNCLDCNGGTTVDRLAVLTEIYAHQLTLALDFGAQGLTSGQLDLGRLSSSGYPIDLAQDDDVFQYMAAVTKIDPPVRLRERVDRGEVVVNYGGQLVYRKQQMAFRDDECAGVTSLTDPAQVPPMCVVPPTAPEQTPKLAFVNALLMQPNVWLKLQYKILTVEFEGTAVLGRMDRGGLLVAAPEDRDSRVTFRQFGWVLANELRLYRDTFFVGVETGGATGDQAESRGYLNYRWRYVQQPAGDRSIRDFKFSPDYHVDSILFRHILGTVTNAVYIKPAISYWFDLQQTRQLGIAGSFIYSVAQVPVSTPGNALGYGLEMNASLLYRNTGEGFYAGITWGVLWPMGALNRPVSIWAGEAADAKAAQIFRGFLGVRF